MAPTMLKLLVTELVASGSKPIPESGFLACTKHTSRLLHDERQVDSFHIQSQVSAVYGNPRGWHGTRPDRP